MLLKNHKIILRYIINQWQNNNGKLVVLEKGNEHYNNLKKELDLNDDYLLTSLFYLENIDAIMKPEHILDKDSLKYVPTPKGLEYNKNWFCREDNYKWYIGILLTLVGLILGYFIGKQ